MNEVNVQRLGVSREELAGRIAGVTREDGVLEIAEGLFFNRVSRPLDGIHGVSKPSLCIIAQGAKEIYLGDCCYRYDTEHYLLATVELPITGRITQASGVRPYLSLRIELDPALVGSVMIEAGIPVPHGPADAKAIVVSALEADLLDSALRFVRLLDSPSEARVLAPLIKREIVYRLLIGEQGNRLRHLPMLGGNSHIIAQAVHRLQQDFDQPLRIESIARELGMSSSGFHHHFKAVTDMSPLQFQKQLRLQEARRLMLGEDIDAATAGFRVGYEDPSHFSRDYKKRFGNPPARDMERLRGDLSAVADPGA